MKVFPEMFLWGGAAAASPINGAIARAYSQPICRTGLSLKQQSHNK